MSQGMLGHFGFVKESTWGTASFAPGSCTNFVELMSENIHVEIDRFETANVYGGIYERDDSAGIRRVAGQAVFAGHPQNLGYFLNAITGGNSTVTSLGTTFTRTAFNFSTSDTSSLCPVPSYTAEIYRDVTTAQLYTGVAVTQLAMNVAPNQDLRCTADVIGKISSGSGNLKSTPTFPTSPTGPFTFDTASLSIGGAAVDLVEAFTITLNQNLEGVPALNATTAIARVRRTNANQVRLSGTIAFENITDYDRFLNQTEVAAVMSLTKASSFQLILDVPRMVYTAFPTAMPGKERLTVGFEGMGRYHAGSASAFQARLTTLVASGAFS